MSKDTGYSCFAHSWQRAHLICLALYAEVHDVVAADGAVLHLDVPGPQRTGVPPLYLEPGAGVQLGRGRVLLLLMVTLLHTSHSQQALVFLQCDSVIYYTVIVSTATKTFADISH